MNQTSLIILLTLIVWSRCDSPPLEEEETPSRSHKSDLAEIDWESSDDEPDQSEPEESQVELSEPDPSASSPIEMVRNQSEMNINLAHFLKNPNIYPQLEQLKRNSNNGQHLLHPSSAQQHNLMSDFLRSLVNNSTTHSSEDKNKNSTNTTYDIHDLKQYYQQVTPSAATDEVPKPEYHHHHANHNYFPNGDWRPLISTSEHQLASWGQPRDAQQGSSGSEIPTSLANFYVESDRLLHAHESQTNKDLKDAKDPTSTNLATTVKDLISTKDAPTGPKGEKLSSVSHKHGYVPVENPDKYQEYLTCCEKLFNNYAHKDYYHEDIYLVPKGEEHLYKGPPLGPPMMVGHHPGLKPVSYFRGHPIIEGDMKLMGGLPGKELPPGKHIPVQCLEDRHHSGHLIPAYHGSHPPPMFYPPPPALLLKKKLALIGKKYFFGK